MLLGKPSSGKSSILYRLFSKEFHKIYLPTIGLDYFEKYFSQYNILANCFDFGGVNLIDDLSSSYFREVDVALLVCDFFNDAVEKHFKKISRSLKNQSSSKVNFVVVRNKCDCIPITNAELQQFEFYSRSNNFQRVIISAKTLQNFNFLQEAIFSSVKDQNEKEFSTGYSSISDSIF